ncbi:MAG: DUF3795 domain-containing protein [Anaerolineae bacterium]|nr:DUF3795 domain-containing protein [Anaerolineae bacterium]
MTEVPGTMMAVCGLDCGSCDIRRAPFDPEAARSVVTWFKERGWLEEHEGIEQVIARKMYCNGCRGDRTVHWSPDCVLLKCCVDERGLEHCGQCPDFVTCERIEAFANDGHRHHQEAVERLRRMRGSGP